MTTVDRTGTVRLGQGTTFVMGIFSELSTEGEAQRRLTRETYLQDPDYCPLKELLNARHSSPSECHVYYTFVVGGAGDESPTVHWHDATVILPHSSEEEAMKGDIVRLNIKENDGFGKSLTWFKYTNTLLHQAYPIDYVAKVEGNTLIDTKYLTQLIIRDLPPAPYNKGIYAGRPCANTQNQVMFARKPFYILSSDLVWKVSSRSKSGTMKKLTYSEFPIESQAIATLMGFRTSWMNLEKYKF